MTTQTESESPAYVRFSPVRRFYSMDHSQDVFMKDLKMTYKKLDPQEKWIESRADSLICDWPRHMKRRPEDGGHEFQSELDPNIAPQTILKGSRAE